MNPTAKTIGTDVVERTEFHFGSYRYVVERYRHNKPADKSAEEGPESPLLLRLYEETGQFIGTKVYRFQDMPNMLYERSVALAVIRRAHLTDEGVKEGLLNETIRPVEQDPFDYEEHFLPKERVRYIPREDVKLPYPELHSPYDRCPNCRHKLDPDVAIDPEDAEDFFNSRSGFNGEYEECSWQEVHRCPHCGKRFYIEASN